MNLKRETIIFILQICPLLVYGTVTITSTGTQVIGEKLVLTCNIQTVSPFSDTATWAQDGTVRTTCASSFCTIYKYGNYTTFIYSSHHINVTFDPVHSSIDGVWQCTHLTLGSDSFNVTAMDKAQTAPSTTPGDTNGSPDDKGDGKDLGIGLYTGIVVITYIIVIVLVAKRLSIKSTEETSGNCFLTFYQFIEEQFFDCCGNKNNQENPIEECLSPTTKTHVVIEGDPDFFADKVLTLNSLLGFVYLVVYGLFVGAIILFAVYYGYSNFQEGLVAGVGLAILFVLSCLCLVVVWILMKFVTNEKSKCEEKPEILKL